MEHVKAGRLGKKVGRASTILFGTDFPPGGTRQEVARKLAELGIFDQRSIDRDNVKLLPQLRTAVL